MANFQVTRKSFNDSLDQMRVIFGLEGEPGDPIADRLAGTAVCPAEPNPVRGEVSGGGLVKDAVIAGAITISEGQALKSTLGKLIAHWLKDYDA